MKKIMIIIVRVEQIADHTLRTHDFSGLVIYLIEYLPESLSIGRFFVHGFH